MTPTYAEMLKGATTWKDSHNGVQFLLSHHGYRDGSEYDGAKVGCDYAHLWHMERGYPDSYRSVREDAVRTVESFLKAHPDRLLTSGYSGKWGTPDQFYTAINGSLVHLTDEIPDGWAKWLRPAVIA